MNTDPVFQLVDRVLPFEACLFHQILPLSIVDSKLHLGMVMLDDAAALEYARRMAGYQNYTLVPQSISSEVHHKTLTAYLNYSQNAATLKAAAVEQKPIAAPKNVSVHDRDTIILESPDEIDWQDSDSSDLHASIHNSPTEVYSTPGGSSPEQDSSNAETQFLEAASNTPLPDPSLPSSLPALPVSTRYLNEPIALLTQLPPARLLHELLGRVLGEGIGRLYLERQPQHGRILWSQNGNLQGSIERVPLSKFQAMLDQLKELTHLPLTPVTQTQQVEIERWHQRDRVLLRLRIIPSDLGEQATLQVLRGAALKFHQRQQVTTLSRDTLAIVQKLQDKISELHRHTRKASPSIIDQVQPDMIPALNQVLQIVEQQLSEIKQIRDSQSNED